MLRILGNYEGENLITEIELQLLREHLRFYCWLEITARAFQKTIGLRLLFLKTHGDGACVVDPNATLMELVQNLKKKGKLGKMCLPQEALSHQDDARNEACYETITRKLAEMGKNDDFRNWHHVINGKFEFLHREAKNLFINTLREQTAQKRTPSGGFTSLDYEIEQAGEDLHFQSDSNPEKEVYDGSIENLIREIEAKDSRLGTAARIYFEADKRPTQAEVGEQLGVTDRTIRTDLQKIKMFLEKKIQEKTQN